MNFKFDPYGRNDFDDEQIVRDRHWHIKPGDVVIDVGAAIGSYTLPALAAGAAKVIAFCPQQDHAQKLKENLTKNPGFAERCTIVPHGLYDQEGWLTFVGSNYLFQETRPDRLGSEDFPVRRLDDVDLKVDKIDWLKLDVEGAELKVLEAARDLLIKYHPQILVENHLFMDKSIQARVGLFILSLDLGYTMFATDYCDVSHSFFEVK